ncbi:MAG: DNA-binding response regulator, partial [Planctomycetales bacterium]|nr:DNA-binding response regulator [Planctomycetales bacterium]NIN09486.1 DNA-binding response regulator [Planctomycetales bacterium]NIN78594.1 DNA-binding response regulator [Planctomycetales bacterium]NIO35788.1 DNA-binding response regulator [Planctomycetales bacterium]NIO47539.1 DNA-binding response regulator [Planctomycetales bacterium]
VLDAIHTVLDGGVYFSPDMKQRVLLQVGESSDGEVPPDLTLLSNRELEVFQLIGRGRQTREIADSLNLSVKTIETYRGNIKAKLKLDTSTDLICRAVRWAVEQGLQ